ncbi:DNA-binding protein [Paraburkholderia sp. MMS20-SJTN17]|uniref:DNA-binding protein n=1 Tax=Paraburkholderia translucens TaxID=2886945 RepID=A0ABS8K890_9BURK|nr:DNA-binding protein [Paraburkholderia sp. MMS20-SJTN17]MCC8400956.1 DNA-binding protein [Paraburkholderia sp. MMS20-SJTN17]
MESNKSPTKTVLPEILTTAEAARAINRQPQTLRKWACLGNGPLIPVRIHGRLGWKAADIAALIG